MSSGGLRQALLTVFMGLPLGSSLKVKVVVGETREKLPLRGLEGGSLSVVIDPSATLGDYLLLVTVERHGIGHRDSARERFSGPNVQFCVIGDGWEECDAAQAMRWPFVKIDVQPSSSHRFPGLTLTTLGHYFSVVYGNSNAPNDDD
ncbi:eyes absent-like protein [Actinidia rufa]|uniref:protein-tyrosine-phosphatase n=1 Tax=Actinidia rufa TaxID=165716 RepID=A0A7J0FQ41_9ERIC|nr:eyes absent-like protein [Actinidia rufa]